MKPSFHYFGIDALNEKKRKIGIQQNLPWEEFEVVIVKADVSGGKGEWWVGDATPPCGWGMGSNWLE